MVNKVAEDAAIRERNSEVLHLQKQCVHPHFSQITSKRKVHLSVTGHFNVLKALNKLTLTLFCCSDRNVVFYRGRILTGLHTVEFTHSSDPVHQQRYLSAAVFMWCARWSRDQREVLISFQQCQPLLGSQGSLQEANFFPQLIFIQNHFHL